MKLNQRLVFTVGMVWGFSGLWAQTAPGGAPSAVAPAHYAEVRGLHMYYEVRGSGSPLVFLHGGGSTPAFSFGLQLPFFEKNHWVIAPAQMGQGLTPDTNRPLDYSEMMEDTVALLRALKVKDADVVGWSDGGILGLMLAAKHPELVRHLVISGANIRPDGLNASSVEELRHPVKREEWTKPWQLDWLNGYAATSPDGKEHFFVMQEKLRALWMNSPTAADLTWEQLGSIVAPTLVVAGDRDDILGEHTLKIFNAIPRARLCILPGTSHFTFSEQADRLNAIIAEFLKEPVK